MKMNKLLIIGTALGLGLVACKSKKDLQKSPEEIKEEIDSSVNDMFSDLDDAHDEEQVKVVERPIYQAAEKRINDVIHTKLEVSFDWKNHYLNGEATLNMTPYFYPTDSLTLDAKGMEIHRVALINNKAFKDLEYSYDDHLFLRIKLDKTYKRGEEYKIYVKYTAKPDEFEMGGSSAISGDKGLYFINADSSEVGKPTQIWTQGETEASSRWFPTIDAPNEKMTQEIEITVDKKYKTLSNGLLIFSTENGDGTRTDVWKQSLPHTPYLAMMAIGDFALVKDSWKRPNGKKMEVNYYVEKEYEQYAKDIFGETPRMITYFSELLGVEYPWEKYSQVVVRDYVSGAMENTTATIHGEFLHRTKRELLDQHNESIIAHELFHHWFGDYVTCESWSNLPLNESFANYSQFLWDEYAHGMDEAEYNAENEMMGYMYTAKQSGYVDMIRYDFGDKEEMFDGNSYNKGGRILHMLRQYVGDEAFFLSLNKYLTDNKFGNAEIDHLRLAFEEVTGEDLHWFFNQWFLDKGHPIVSFDVDYSAGDDKVMIISKQEQNLEVAPLYKLPIAVNIYSERTTPSGDESKDGPILSSHIIWLDASVDTFYLDVNAKETVKLVDIDATKSLLAEMEYDKELDAIIYQYSNAPKYANRKEAVLYCKSKSDDAALDLMMAALKDKFWGIRELAVRNLRKVARKRPEELKPVLMDMIKNDPQSSVRAAALTALQKYYKSDDFTDLYVEASKDSSFYVNSVALGSLAESNLDKAYEMAKTYENETSSSILTTVGSIYSKKGNKEDHAFFKKNWTAIGGFEKISFLNTYSAFLKQQDDATILEGMEIFKEVAKNGGTMWVKYFAGYQTIMKFRENYFVGMSESDKEIKRLEAEGASSSDINLKQREMEENKKMFDALDKMLEELKAEETNEQILDFIDSGASMEIGG